MRAEAKAPSRKWPWVVVAIAAIVAIAVAAAVWSTQGGDARPEPSSSATAAPEEPASAEDPAPTGCLGGAELGATSVVSAQAAAPHTSNGAVEVAAALVRFAYRYPYPSADDSQNVGQDVIASDAPSGFKDLAALYAMEPNLSGGLVEDGTDYSVSTVPGVWHLESYSGDEASVTIGGGLIKEGALSPTLKISATVYLSWESDGWHVAGIEGTRTTESLYQVGIPFAGGC